MEEKLKKLKEAVREYQENLKNFDSRDCFYSDYDYFNFRKCCHHRYNKQSEQISCSEKNCPYIITFNLNPLENADE